MACLRIEEEVNEMKYLLLSIFTDSLLLAGCAGMPVKTKIVNQKSQL